MTNLASIQNNFFLKPNYIMLNNNFDNQFLYLYKTYDYWIINNNCKRLVENLSKKINLIYPQHEKKFVQSYVLTMIFNFFVI